MDVFQGVKHRFCSWREIPPFIFVQVTVYNFLHNSIQKGCSCENTLLQLHAQVEAAYSLRLRRL